MGNGGEEDVRVFSQETGGRGAEMGGYEADWG